MAADDDHLSVIHETSDPNGNKNKASREGIINDSAQSDKYFVNGIVNCETDQTQDTETGFEADHTQEAEVINTGAGGSGLEGNKTQEAEVVDTGAGISGIEEDQTQEVEVLEPAVNDNTPVESNSVLDNGQEVVVVDEGGRFFSFRSRRNTYCCDRSCS